MNAIARATVVAAALAVMSVPALAQEQDSRGWYAGIGLGMSKFKGACDGVSGSGVSCDENDTAFKLFGGYQVNRNFAVELGYTDLGKAKASFSGFGDVSIAASGFEALAVGIVPINPQWSLIGKLGLFRWDVDFNDGTGLVGSGSASGTNVTYALGVGYQFTPKAAVRVEYQQYKDIGDENVTGKGDVNVIGANVLYRF